MAGSKYAKLILTEKKREGISLAKTVYGNTRGIKKNDLALLQSIYSYTKAPSAAAS
jgi:hypothetical protein